MAKCEEKERKRMNSKMGHIATNQISKQNQCLLLFVVSVHETNTV